MLFKYKAADYINWQIFHCNSQLYYFRSFFIWLIIDLYFYSEILITIRNTDEGVRETSYGVDAQ